MQLFVVNGKDFTNHITVPSYKVNKEPVCEEWTDANYITHKEITRYNINGSFKVWYDDIAELDDFFDTINNLKAASSDESIEVQVYLNSTHTVETATVFIEYTPSNEKPLFQREKVSGFEVKIKEK